jgi:hypothetical protein
MLFVIQYKRGGVSLKKIISFTLLSFIFMPALHTQNVVDTQLADSLCPK